MPLSGDASDKYGNRYEGKWTVYCLAKLLSNEADVIRLSPLGVEGSGCEFWLRKGTITEYHQVKRQHSGPNAWSIRELMANGVLRTAFEKTREANHCFQLVSTISIGPLTELVDSAGTSRDFREFNASFATGSREKSLKQLLDAWDQLIMAEFPDIRNVPEQKKRDDQVRILHNRLRRIRVKTIGEDDLTELVESRLEVLIRKNPQQVRNDLAAFAIENVHNEISAHAIWSYLKEKFGYQPRDIEKDACELAAIDQANHRYDRRMKPFRIDYLIEREEAISAFNILLGNDQKHSVLISGIAGIGKTVILGQIIRLIEREKIPYLYFRVDGLKPTILPKEVGCQIGLSGSPSSILAGLAKERSCVLIIDQLDAVSRVSGSNSDFFDCIHQITIEAMHGTISSVIALKRSV